MNFDQIKNIHFVGIGGIGMSGIAGILAAAGTDVSGCDLKPSAATDLLAAHGISYAYIAFEGEAHGFRKAENIAASLEAELSFYGQIMGFIPPGVRPVPLANG